MMRRLTLALRITQKRVHILWISQEKDAQDRGAWSRARKDDRDKNSNGRKLGERRV